MFKAITLSIFVVLVVLLGTSSANAATTGPPSGGPPGGPPSNLCFNNLSPSLQNPIIFNKMCYTQSETAILKIWDNTISGRITTSLTTLPTTISAKIISENDREGISIQLIRSGSDPNVYTGVVHFSNNFPSNANGNQIHVMPGNFVYAIYNNQIDAHTLVYDGNNIMFDSPKYVKNYYGRVLLLVPTNPITTTPNPTATVHLSSSSDTNGIDLTLRPIEQGSPIYSTDSLIQFFSETSTQNGAIAIKTSGGDTVTASAESGSSRISTTATIGTENSVAVGEGPGGGNLQTFGQGAPQYTANCASFGLDTDGDGLCNNWEQTDGSLKVQISNPASTFVFPVCSSSTQWPNCTGGTTGATNLLSPQKFSKYTKDVAVQFDYYTQSPPDTTALTNIITKFASHSVNLHIQTGPKITGITLADQNPIADNSIIKFPDDFNTIRSIIFASHDSGNGNSTPKIAKSQVFHFGLNAYQMKDATGAILTTSGYGEEPGNDFVVSIWNWPGILEVSPTAPPLVPSTNIQQATFMHELGHNLGLKHGGSDYNNCKPNYISVMNYLYTYQAEVPLLPSETYVPDYSSYSGFNSLNEASLSESRGLGPAQSNSQYAVIGSQNNTMSYMVVGPLSTTGPNAADFDRAATDNSSVDLNLFSFADCWGSPNGASSGGHAVDTLNPSNDWSTMNYNFRTSSSFNTDPIMTDPNELKEMNLTSFKSAVVAGLDYTQNRLLSGASGNNTTIVNNAFENAKTYVNDGDFGNAIAALNDTIGNDFNNVITDDNHHSLHDLYQGEITALESAKPMPYVGPTTPPVPLDSPLGQYKKGVPIKDIQCKPGFSLIQKVTNGTPACVSPTTKTTLIDKGWGVDVSSGKNPLLTQNP